MDPDPFGLDFCGGFEDCARLHFGNFRECNPEPATAMTKHRIKFVQLTNAPRDVFHGDAEFVCQLTLLRVIGGQEFMKRRIQKADGCRQSV